MKKRILSAFLVLCMMLTMVPTAALQKIGESPIFSKFSTAYRIIRSNPRSTMMRTEIIP